MKFSIVLLSIVAACFSLVSTDAYASSSGSPFDCSWQHISRERLHIGPPNIITEKIVESCVSGQKTAGTRTVVVGVYEDCYISISDDEEFSYTGACLNPSFRQHELCDVTIPGYRRYSGWARCTSWGQDSRHHYHTRYVSNSRFDWVHLGSIAEGFCTAFIPLVPNWQDPIVVGQERCPESPVVTPTPTPTPPPTPTYIKQTFTNPTHNGHRVGYYGNNSAIIYESANAFCRAQGFEIWTDAPPVYSNIGGSTYTYFQNGQWTISGSSNIHAISFLTCRREA